MLKVLSTKMLPDHLTDVAREMGLSLTCAEFISIHELDFDMSALMSVIYDAMVFTSSNAVKSFFENENIHPLPDSVFKPPLGGLEVKPVYAISGKTKDELAKHGIEPLATADNAEQLAVKIAANEKIRAVLHICGNVTLDTLERKLADEGLSYVPIIVYETKLSSVEINEPYDALMLYSPSGVESFVIKNKLAQDALYCCIGETTAAKLKAIDDKIDIILPKQPTPDGMLAAISAFKEIKDKI